MGGAVKPALPLCGKPMISWVLEAAEAVAKSVVVAASPYTLNALKRLGVCERVDGCLELSGKGYWADISYAASIVRARPLLVVPSDTPFITPNILGEFISRALEAEACLVSLEGERGLIGVSLLKCGWKPWANVRLGLGVHGLNVNTWRDYVEAWRLCRQLAGSTAAR